MVDDPWNFARATVFEEQGTLVREHHGGRWGAMIMVAVRNLLSTLNNLAQTRLVANGWTSLAEQDDAVGAGDGTVREAPPEPWWEGAYVEGGVEPPLEEVLGDPVIHLMMRADRLDPEQVRRLLTSGQRHAEP